MTTGSNCQAVIQAAGSVWNMVMCPAVLVQILLVNQYQHQHHHHNRHHWFQSVFAAMLGWEQGCRQRLQRLGCGR
jgi:hypothetical protein